MEGQSWLRSVLLLLISAIVVTSPTDDLSVSQQAYLQPGVITVKEIPPLSDETFSVTNISSTTSFLIFQVHTQYLNVSASLSENFLIGQTETGSSVGVLHVSSNPAEETVNFYLRSQNNVTVKVLLLVQMFEDAPVPGGCNQVFPLENDPNIHILESSNSYQTTIQFQWASLAHSALTAVSCEDKKQKNLMYDIYVYYMKEGDIGSKGFFDAMQRMMTVNDIVANGRKIASFSNSNSRKSLAKITSNQAQGAIYGIIVRQTDTEERASYVSISTYSCSFEDGSCSFLASHYPAEAVVGALVCMITGIFLCFFGHHFFKLEMVVIGFFSFAIIVANVLGQIPGARPSYFMYPFSVVAGLAGGLLWMFIWTRTKIPAIAVALVGLLSGYLFACIIFFTPFGNILYWTNSASYGLTFACFVLLVPAVLLIKTRLLNLISCAFVGSYLIIFGIDIFARSNLKQIFLNAMKHSVVPDYLDVIVVTPFEITDIILAVIWGIITCVGFGVQMYRERSRPAFPMQIQESLNRSGVNGNGSHHSSPRSQPEPNGSPRSSGAGPSKVDLESSPVQASGSNLESVLSPGSPTAGSSPRGAEEDETKPLLHAEQPTYFTNSYSDGNV